jgi:putative endonuclease
MKSGNHLTPTSPAGILLHLEYRRAILFDPPIMSCQRARRGKPRVMGPHNTCPVFRLIVLEIFSVTVVKWRVKYHVYIIESEPSGKWYVGFTSCIEDRLEYHNCGFNPSTRQGRPWKIIFKRLATSRNEARQFEKYLKATRNKDFIRKKFAEYFIAV